MSWFGGGTKKEEPVKEIAFENSNDSFGTGNVSTPGNSEAFQRALQVEQQKALIQAVMFKLTDLSFENCIQNPGTALSSSERTCIAAVTGKYLEASEEIAAKISRQK